MSSRKRFKSILKYSDSRFKEIMKYDKNIYVKWIESNFDSNMTWDNYGKYWHIDHIKPCSSYNLENEDEYLECFNWRNLRPCEIKENLYKSNKIDNNIINNYKQKALQFYTNYSANIESNN